MDASANYREKELAGLKFSSGYIPPEMLWADADGKVAMRCVDRGADSGLIFADPSLEY